jgi:hypothetical protein
MFSMCLFGYTCCNACSWRKLISNLQNQLIHESLNELRKKVRFLHFCTLYLFMFSKPYEVTNIALACSTKTLAWVPWILGSNFYDKIAWILDSVYIWRITFLPEVSSVQWLDLSLTTWRIWFKSWQILECLWILILKRPL